MPSQNIHHQTLTCCIGRYHRMHHIKTNIFTLKTCTHNVSQQYQIPIRIIMIRIYKNQPGYCCLEIRSRKRLYGLWIQKKYPKLEEPFHSAQEPLLVPKHLAVSGHPAWNLQLQHGLPIFSWNVGCRCFREKRLTLGQKWHERLTPIVTANQSISCQVV